MTALTGRAASQPGLLPFCRRVCLSQGATKTRHACAAPFNSVPDKFKVTSAHTNVSVQVYGASQIRAHLNSTGCKTNLAILVAVRSCGWGFPSKYQRPSSLIAMLRL